MHNYIFLMITDFACVDSYGCYPIVAIEKAVEPVIARSRILDYGDDRNLESVAKKHCRITDGRFHKEWGRKVEQYG